MKIAILGAGMVGRAMAIDLAKTFDVTSFDLSEKNLQLLKQANPSIHTTVADLQAYEKYAGWLKWTWL
jgi:3-hydroxyacyl-CoA dehydrogenase